MNNSWTIHLEQENARLRENNTKLTERNEAIEASHKELMGVVTMLLRTGGFEPVAAVTVEANAILKEAQKIA